MTDENFLSEAEKRRRRLRESINKRIEDDQKFALGNDVISKREAEKKRQEQEIQLKLQKQREAKMKEEATIAKAEGFLDNAKKLVDNKKFKDAKESYRKAIEVFKSLGWWPQVEQLYVEIKNVDKYETEHLKKIEKQKERERLQQKEFQKRIAKEMALKKLEEEKKLAQRKKYPAFIQQKLEKIELALQRAEKEEEMNKIQKSQGRYEYIIELYGSISSEEFDFSNEIAEIQKKIANLRSKL